MLAIHRRAWVADANSTLPDSSRDLECSKSRDRGRVLHVCLVGLQRFLGPVGVCRYTANLFSSLRESDDIRVTLVLGKWQKEYYREAFGLDVNDPHILWVNLWRPSISRYWWSLKELPRLVQRIDADVVHALHQMPVVKELFQVPLVLTIHDLYAYDEPRALGYPNVYLNRFAIRSCLRASDEVVSISRFTRSRLQHWFPKLNERMMLPVIYQQVRVAEPRRDLDQLATVPARIFLCVAQHRKNKNLDLVIQSYHLGIERQLIDKDCQLVIVGSQGTETGNLKSISRRGSGVHFLDSLSDSGLAYLYSVCLLFICASSIEGFCLPVAEALLFSCRIVCPDIPVIREVAGEQATYFDLEPRSPDALLRAMLRSLAPDDGCRAKAPLSTSDPAKEWVQLYQEVHGRFAEA
jgi:glycosyltransferase involved in cell wall biosynthesis